VRYRANQTLTMGRRTLWGKGGQAANLERFHSRIGIFAHALCVAGRDLKPSTRDYYRAYYCLKKPKEARTKRDSELNPVALPVEVTVEARILRRIRRLS
jgi:hypothetical protein